MAWLRTNAFINSHLFYDWNGHEETWAEQEIKIEIDFWFNNCKNWDNILSDCWTSSILIFDQSNAKKLTCNVLFHMHRFMSYPSLHDKNRKDGEPQYPRVISDILMMNKPHKNLWILIVCFMFRFSLHFHHHHLNRCCVRVRFLIHFPTFRFFLVFFSIFFLPISSFHNILWHLNSFILE